MTIKLLASAAVIMFSSTSISYKTKSNNSQYVYYKLGDKISWNSFVKKSNINDASAESSTAISYDYTEKDGKVVSVQVSAVLIKNESYCIASKCTDYLLNHEQRHFDITFIFSQIFIERLKKEDQLSEKKVSIIYNQVIKEWNAFQDQYDYETDHSQNVLEQQRWDYKIQSLL